MENRVSGAEIPDIEGEAWADRCSYWLKKSTRKGRQFKARAGVRQPLILSGHGVRLRVNRGTLWVQNGFTHYPQEQETWRFFPGDWRLPSRIVVLDVDGSLSFDALSWLSQHGVPLIQINWRGDLVNVIGNRSDVIVPAKVRSQLRRQIEDGGLEFSLSLLKQKATNSIGTLRDCFPQSPPLEKAIDKLNDYLADLKRSRPATLNHLMGIEGGIAITYFGAWRGHPLKWKDMDRHPIPDDWHRIEPRASKVGTQRNRNATHPVNAIINYAYGILESQVRMEVVAVGFDPTIGSLHGNVRGKHGLVYDLMEPLRPIVDRAVLTFLQLHTFHRSDFTIRHDGVCRLNPEMARCVVRAVLATRATAFSHSA